LKCTPRALIDRESVTLRARRRFGRGWEPNRRAVRRSRHAIRCEAGASHDAFPSGSLGTRNGVTLGPRKSLSTVRDQALTSWPRWRNAAIGSASHRCNEHRRVASPQRFSSHRTLHQAVFLPTVSCPADPAVALASRRISWSNQIGVLLAGGPFGGSGSQTVSRPQLPSPSNRSAQ
jgi:hypothetical protein